MLRSKTILLAGGTAFSAFAIGYVMQFGVPGFGAAPGPVAVSDITDTSAPADVSQTLTSVEAVPGMADLPAIPLASEAEIAAALPAEPITLAAVDTGTISDAILPQETPSAGFDCAITATAEPAAGAMVALSVDAPCHSSERVTIHHNGMMFTDIVQPDGTLSRDVPALSEQAMFILSFATGDGAVAQAEVTSLAFYDRIALQWRGQGGGLELHAREMGAEYFTDGHVWQGARGSLEAAARGQGGFLTRLGDSEAPEALLVDIYSFPRGTAQRSGEIAVTVEAEVTASNCGSDVEAQTIEFHGGPGLKVQDLTLAMPGCDAIGDFLVLNEIVSDIEVAAR